MYYVLLMICDVKKEGEIGRNGDWEKM